MIKYMLTCWVECYNGKYMHCKSDLKHQKPSVNIVWKKIYSIDIQECVSIFKMQHSGDFSIVGLIIFNNHDIFNTVFQLAVFCCLNQIKRRHSSLSAPVWKSCSVAVRNLSVLSTSWHSSHCYIKYCVASSTRWICEKEMTQGGQISTVK